MVEKRWNRSCLIQYVTMHRLVLIKGSHSLHHMLFNISTKCLCGRGVDEICFEIDDWYLLIIKILNFNRRRLGIKQLKQTNLNKQK